MQGKKCRHIAKDDPKRERIVGPLFDKWMHTLGLHPSWRVAYGFVDDLGEEDDRSNGTKVARSSNLYPYHEATLLLVREAIDHGSTGDVERLIIHELLHVLNAPLDASLGECVPLKNMKEVGDKTEEMVDWMTNILLSMTVEEEEGE